MTSTKAYLSGKELALALQPMSRIYGRKCLAPTAGLVQLHKTSTGLTITADDGECRISEDVPCHGEGVWWVYVYATHLAALASANPDGISLSLEGDKQDRLQVSGDHSATLPVVPDIDPPSNESQDANPVAVNPTQLARAVSSVVWASDPTSQDTQTQWVDVVCDKGGITAVATDRRIITRCKIPEACEAASFLIDSRFHKGIEAALARYASSVWLSPSKIIIRHEKGGFSAPMPNGSALPGGKVLDRATRALTTSDVGPIKEAAKMSMQLARGSGVPRASITLGPKTWFSFEAANYLKELPVSGPEFKMSFNPDKLFAAMDQLAGPINWVVEEGEDHNFVVFSQPGLEIAVPLMVEK